MRKFYSEWDGWVDLDDPNTYKYIKTKSPKVMYNKIMQRIGYVHMYMNYFHYDLFHEKTGISQRLEIERLFKDFYNNLPKRRNDILWLKEFYYVLFEQTDNMI